MIIITDINIQVSDSVSDSVSAEHACLVNLYIEMTEHACFMQFYVSFDVEVGFLFRLMENVPLVFAIPKIFSELDFKKDLI